MHIQKLTLQNFKRFTDLTIDLSQCNTPPKLVLLIGTNGSGKSSVFDALSIVKHFIETSDHNQDASYYKKDIKKSLLIELVNSRQVISFKIGIQNVIHLDGNVLGSSFYGRTSLRQIPALTRTSRTQLNDISFENDEDRSQKFIDRDIRFENDLEKITEQILKDVFKSDRSTHQIKEQFINPINDAFARIFGDDENTLLRLTVLSPPLDGRVAEILFEKGVSEIHYNLLSSGEKEIFNILINFLSRRRYFTDTIYFLDEIDLHLNTYLQKKLLKEITEYWLPENCQLWTASHSLGFIEYANETAHSEIIDLDSLNFDQPQTLYPSTKNKFETFEIAVSQEFLSKLLEGKNIFFAENTDALIYNNLKLDDIIFFTAVDKKDVFYKTQNLQYKGIIDRDYLTDDEIDNIKVHYKNLSILNYYSLENYLYHPDNLEEYFNGRGKTFDKKSYTDQITESKNNNRDKIILGISLARSGYPFFKENDKDKSLKSFKKNDEAILQLLKSDDFEMFYKVFPAKDYGTQIPQRQNLDKIQLGQTSWLKNKISSILNKSYHATTEKK